MQDIKQDIENTCDQLKNILIRKNQDYGNSAMTAPILMPEIAIETSINVRMSDKIARLRTLLSGAETCRVDESIEDTLLDLAGYCILRIIVNNKQKETTCYLSVLNAEKTT